MASENQQAAQPLDLGAALNGRTSRSRPAPVAVVPQNLPSAPAAPIILPPAPVAQEPVAAVMEQPQAQLQLPASTNQKPAVDDKDPGKKQTFAIKPQNDIMLEQLVYHKRKPKTYFVNKALEMYLKTMPAASIPIPPDEDEDD